MTIETHVLDRDCVCARCSLDLKPIMDFAPEDYTKMKRGDRIGVISGLSIGPQAYLIKSDHDSNKLCIPLRDAVKELR